MASASPSSTPRPSAPSHRAGLWIILSGILLFTLLAAFASSMQNERHARSEFRRAVDRYQGDIDRQLRGLQVATLGMAAGMAGGAEPVSRARGDRLAAALNATGSLGALGAIDLLDRVETGEFDAWRSSVQRQDPEYPLQAGQAAASSRERLLLRNRWPTPMAYDAIGRDLGAQAQRMDAARVADGSKLPVLSRIFIESTPDGPLAAYVMMAPVAPTADAEAPRRQLQPPVPPLYGTSARQWISLLVLADELFRGPLTAADAPLRVQVVDLDAPDARIHGVFDISGARFSDSGTLSAMGREWRLTYTTTPAFEAANRDRATGAILLAGLLVGVGVLLAFLRLRRAEQSASADRARGDARIEQLDGTLPVGVFETDAARLRTSDDIISLRSGITQQTPSALEIRKLAAVAIQAADGVALLDCTGRIEWVNASYERLTGHALDEVRGMRGCEFLQGPLTDPLTSGTIAACVDACVPGQVEIVHYTKQREPVWFEVRSQPLFNDNGTHLGYFQTHFDITVRKAAEAAAAHALAEQQRAETRLVQAIDSLDEAFSLYDENERLVIFNERNRTLARDIGGRIRIGMTKREVLEVIADTHVPASEGLEAREAYIERRLAEHRAGDSHVERRVGHGWYRISLRRTPLGDVVITRADITQAREREAQLEKLSVVASRTANSVVIIDAHNRIEWVNESFERQTEYRMEEVLGRSAEELLTGPLTDAALIGEMVRMIDQGVGCRVELINYRKNGDPYWASIERQPIRDDQGRVVRWIRLSLDVSERKRAELALRSSEAKNRMLATVVQQTTAAVITKDLDNRVTSWNRGAERLYGYPAEQAIGRISHELLNPDITPKHRDGLLARVRSGATDVNRLQHMRADGVRIDIESSHAPQLDDRGALVGRITVIRDITEQLRAQRSIEAARIAAEHSQEAMSTFLSNMSHELRTPMHAILSYARLGQDRISRGLPEKTQQYLDRIEQSGVRLLALLNDLLDLSRLEAGRLPIEPGRHELAMTVDAVILEVAGLAQTRQLAIERIGLRALPAWYDPARITQVLTNVLGNAVKFSSPGGAITISLGQCTSADGRALAEVVVADNGVGIPASEREAIFDKFVQSSATRTGAGGTGLGLAISRELVHAHGGEIRAEENPAGGTRFIFTLPMEPSAHVPAPTTAPADPHAADPGRRAA